MKNRKFWTLKAAEGEPKAGELMLYGEISEISWFGDEVTPQEFKGDLDTLGEIEELRVFINSGGGDVFAAQAIYSMLRRHGSRKIVYIDGLAASAASLVAMAGDRIVMPRNAMLMVHNPWALVIGESRDMRKMADSLDRIRESMIEAYREKTGAEHDYIVGLLDAETWMTAAEAVEMGFADELEETRQVAARIRDDHLVVNGIDVPLDRYSNPPKLAFVPEDEDEPVKPTPDTPGDGDSQRLRLLGLELELVSCKPVVPEEDEL